MTDRERLIGALKQVLYMASAPVENEDEAIEALSAIETYANSCLASLGDEV